jgi:hypothetical protein
MSVPAAGSTGSAAMVLRASVPVLGAMRLALGGWAAARPQGVARGVGVADDQSGTAVPWVYALAAREVVLGVGTLLAWKRGHSGAGWVAAMAASDAFDAVVYQLLAQLGTLDADRARRSTWFALSGAVPEGLTSVALAVRAR